MAKKNRRPSAKKKSSRISALEENTLALKVHTKELARNAVALAAHTAILQDDRAKRLVYSVLQEPLTLPDTTLLSKLLLDEEALGGTAKEIQKRGVNVDTGLVQ